MKHARITSTASLILLCLVVGAALAACSGGGSDAQSGTTTSRTERTSGSSAPEYRQVRFRAADGSKVVGRLWANGDVAVILAHGYSEFIAQDDWLPFAPALARRGYNVLTFNFRGFCDGNNCSGTVNDLGNNWRDMLAALAFMEARGSKDTFLIGASMGGLAVLRAARLPGVDLAGVISLSTPQFPFKYYAAGVPQADDLTPSRLRQIRRAEALRRRQNRRPGARLGAASCRSLECLLRC